LELLIVKSIRFRLIRDAFLLTVFVSDVEFGGSSEFFRLIPGVPVLIQWREIGTLGINVVLRNVSLFVLLNSFHDLWPVLEVE